jgi:hypothetical protein
MHRAAYLLALAIAAVLSLATSASGQEVPAALSGGSQALGDSRLSAAFRMAASGGHGPVAPVIVQRAVLSPEILVAVDPATRLIMVPSGRTKQEACTSIVVGIRFLDTGRWGDTGQPRRCWTRWERRHLRPDPSPGPSQAKRDKHDA